MRGVGGLGGDTARARSGALGFPSEGPRGACALFSF